MSDIYSQLRKISPYVLGMFEQALFNAASEYAKGYNGGYWEPDSIGIDGLNVVRYPTQSTVRLVNPDNYSDAHMDSISAGTALTILSLNRVIWQLHHSGEEAACIAVHNIWEALNEGYHNSPKIGFKTEIMRFLD